MIFVKAAGEVVTSYYDPAEIDVSLITEREVVQLPCGVEALKWKGTLPSTSADQEAYQVYGYSFVYQTINATFGYILEPDCLDDEEMLKDIVDRMVTTLRPTEE